MTDQERLDKINAILDSGQSVTHIGDRRVEHDLDALERQRDNILAKMRGASQYKRVVFKRG